MFGHLARAALKFDRAAVRVFGEEGKVVRDDLDAHVVVEPVDCGAHVFGVETELFAVVEVVAVGKEVLHHGFRTVFG